MNNKYLFAKEKENYEDYSSGRVIYGAPLAPNFPVRLTSELFQRAKAYLREKGSTGPYKIYDPFCGAGYSLTVTGLLFNNDITEIYASDADDVSLEFARKNLSLLTKEGMDMRREELETFIKEYKKESHKDALQSALKLKSQISHDIKTEIFYKDIVEENFFPEFLTNTDMVIADLPYGTLTQWKSENNVQIFLDNMRNILALISIVVLVSNKEQKFTHTGYKKIDKYTLGKRRITCITPLTH